MLEILEVIFAIVGAVLSFVMFLVVVLRDSLMNYLDAKAEELKVKAEERRRNSEED